jgi:hypothetical protein
MPKEEKKKKRKENSRNVQISGGGAEWSESM